MVEGDDVAALDHGGRDGLDDRERALLDLGLQAAVYRCNNCTTPANVIYSGALKNLVLPASGTVAAAGTDYLTFVFSLPVAADNTFQGLTQDFTVTYTATQLAGAAR